MGACKPIFPGKVVTCFLGRFKPGAFGWKPESKPAPAGDDQVYCQGGDNRPNDDRILLKLAWGRVLNAVADLFSPPANFF